MGEITKVSEYIEQAGERWREVLFKKWSFREDIRPEDSCVFLVLKPSPNLNIDQIYDTEREATEALIQSQNARLEKLMKRRHWTKVQYDTHWIRGLENDIHLSTQTMIVEEDKC